MKQNAILVLLGAVLGGFVGFAVFVWLAFRFGAYGFAIPGVVAGLGASLKQGAPSWTAVVSGLVGLGAGLMGTWKATPFRADGSLAFFLANLHQLPLYQQILLALGAAVAFWAALAATGSLRPRKDAPRRHLAFGTLSATLNPSRGFIQP